jgi:hypothetical protein
MSENRPGLKLDGFAPGEDTALLGELHPLVSQLGSTDGLFALSAVSASLKLRRVDSLATLVLFLEVYKMEVLLPLELPAIHRAHQHASRSEVRELVALDQEIARQPILRHFASASQRVGRGQLQRLRPLKDERVVQRYVRAVERKQAHAWHTLVYGLTLALYSLPVRQGLLGYARHTLNGFVRAAAAPLRLSAHDCWELRERWGDDLPAELGTLLATDGNCHPSVS